MDKLATMDTIGSSFRPWLSCQGICLLNRHQTGDTDSVQPVILLPVQRDSQETFIPCEARMLWYSADRTSSQQLRDTTMSCICVDFEKQIVLRTKRLMRVRNVRCLRSIFCVLRLPGVCSSGPRCRV